MTPDALFSTYLRPLYVERPGNADANPGKNPNILRQLGDLADTFVAMHTRVFGADLGLDFSDASVHRLGAALTHSKRDELAAAGPPGTPDNALFNVIAHGVAYVGACVVRSHGGEWLVRQPLWESRVLLRSHAGEAELAILSWWLRSLSDEGFETHVGLGERYRTYVEVPTTRAEDLVPIGPQRELPTLNKVRYDTLVKYLRAHLPELRDVGSDFPSPERFEAYRFERLDFLLVGGARMLVIYGLGEGGLHLLWLDRAGFAKSALLGADPKTPVNVTVKGPTLTFTVTHEGRTLAHEMLWWGP